MRISGGGFAGPSKPPEEGEPPADGPTGGAAGGGVAAEEHEVVARFEKPGVMGFDFDRDSLSVGTLQGPAQEVPHAVEGMILRWVAHGEGPSSERVYLQPNEADEFTRVITNQTRPLTLGFAHPWQAHGEGEQRYFYNSFTDESVWCVLFLSFYAVSLSFCAVFYRLMLFFVLKMM